jgi:hypothetical protein
VTGIATATAFAAAAAVTSSLVSVESAAGVSPESGFDIAFASSAFAAWDFDSWDFDLGPFVVSGFVSASAFACPAGAVSRPVESLFAFFSGAELSRGRAVLAVGVSSARRAAGWLFDGGGEGSPARLLFSAAVLLSINEAKLSFAGGCSDLARRAGAL